MLGFLNTGIGGPVYGGLGPREELFLGGGVLPTDWTFTRAGATKVWGSAGLLVSIASGAPMFTHRYVSGAWRPQGLFMGPGATNLLQSSRSVDAVDWVATNTATTGSATGADGTSKVIAVTDDNSGGSAVELMRQTVTVTADTVTRYGSVLIPKALVAPTTFYPGFSFNYASGLNETVVFNPYTGAVVAVTAEGTVLVQDCGNWWRLIVSLANTSKTSLRFDLRPAASTDGSTNTGTAVGTTAYDFSELRATPITISGPFIETPGSAAVTLPADVAYRTRGLPKGLIVRGRTSTFTAGATQTLAHYDDGTAANTLNIYRASGTNTLMVDLTTASVVVASLNMGALGNDTEFSLAVRVEADNFAASLNGGAVVADTSCALPATTVERLGCNQASLLQFNGTILDHVRFLNPPPDAALRGLTA